MSTRQRLDQAIEARGLLPSRARARDAILRGTVTVNGETAPIKAGDAVPVDLGQTHSFTQTGSEPLEMMVLGIANDMASKEAVIEAAGRR